MPVTIHVNGSSNSLVHKGSMGIAKSTIPDVCKTPSPAGPVPVPYPVIVSMSANLVKGTTTVTVDGGNMAAIKGSELSMCNGDEPGTAGGVMSSTFMKEAAWLLYSFDVKFEGLNACRLSDKMQMNHGNSACLGGVIQQPIPGQFIIILDCKPEWDDCQKAQMRAKADSMDAIAKKRNGLQTRSPKANKALRKVGAKFQSLFQQHSAATTPTGKFPSALEPCKLPKTHYDDCAKTNGKPLQADHVLELQFKGGNPAGPLRMLDSSVNQSSGSQIRALREEHGEMTVLGVQHRGC